MKQWKKKLDFEDLKSRAEYYMFQYEWLSSAHPDSYTSKVGIFEKVLIGGGKFWYGKDKTKDYGRGSYERIRQNMERFPEEFRKMEDNKPIFLQRGDADIAPPVEITRYYKDRDKLYIAERYKVLKSLLGFVEDNAPFKANLEKLTEAIGIYSETQCAVTDDSLEIELAAIDMFRSEADQFFMKKGRIDLRDPYTGIIVDIMQTIDSFARGSLRSEMTDAEFAAALEQTPVYTEHSENDLEESNVKDLPLFTHRPNINDTKQGMCGDCHFLASIQAMVASDP
ncbi:MAG: hypothetical protein K5770_05045 [Lachnospiraceae bacterium]|nr:hypothetical protein [Lachnospiraceae bacterium]